MLGSNGRSGVSKRAKKRSGSARLMVLLALAAFLALAVSAMSAAADPAPSAPSFPTSENIEALRSQGTEALEAQQTDPLAAQELPHSDLSRAEAMHLLRAVFNPALEEPAGIFDELHVEKFLSDTTAVISAGQQPEPDAVAAGKAPDSHSDDATMLESTLPLRTEDASGHLATVDLDLEHAEGEIQPTNPLVEVGLPDDLGEGIALADMQIELVGAPEDLSPTVIDQSVGFWPNVATDTDFVVAPTPTGLETLTQLRSADAPRSQEFHVQLPDGASLASDGEGGAIATSGGGSPIMGIPAPTAIDANGEEVPVSMDVSGDLLTLHVSPDASSAYPILVDPLYEYYAWFINQNSAGLENWGAINTTGGLYGATKFANCGQYCPSPLYSGLPGLYLAAGSGYVPVTQQAAFGYYVPRFFSDAAEYGTYPSTWIEAMATGNLGFWAGADHSALPGLVFGIWNVSAGQWAAKNTAGIWHGGNEADLTNFATSYYIGTSGDQGAKAATFALNGSNSSLGAFRHMYIGYVVMQLGDPDVPKFGSITPPSGWLDGSSSAAIGYKVSDAGLGMTRLIVEEEGALRAIWYTEDGCSGAVSNPCKREWDSSKAGSPTLAYNISKLPQGVTNLKVVGQDPVGNTSAPATAQIKVDRTAPSLSLWGAPSSGGSYEPLVTPTLTLGVQAKDGTTAAPQSGVGSIELKIDGQSTASATCATQNCELTREWPIDLTKYSMGEHTAVVKATDRVGRSTSQERSFQVFKDEQAPELFVPGVGNQLDQYIETLPEGPDPMSLVEGPSGWVPDGIFRLTSGATDNVGIKSLKVLVDGASVGESVSCPYQNCSTQNAWTVDTADYSGGTHAVKVVAEDPRGNKASKEWTIRVNPDGGISAEEAAATLEAVEETSVDTAPVAPTDDLISAEERADGNDPGLEQDGDQLVSTGTPATSNLTVDPSDGVRIEGADGDVSIQPINEGEEDGATVVANEVAAVTPGSGGSVDTVVRPKFDGVMSFQSIRDASAPEDYSWEVTLGEGQTLNEIDNQHAGIYYEDGTEAVLISAEPAHDANGSAVPTTLAVSEDNVITLTIHHQGSTFVYPVVGGAAFEVGYAIIEVVTPPEPEPEPEESPTYGGPVNFGKVGPPVPLPSGDTDDQGASASSAGGKMYFEWTQCLWDVLPKGCDAAHTTIMGAWEYNKKFAWWKESKPHPGCPYDTGMGFSEQLDYCNWKGKNHQQYGDGYHISAQVLWHMTSIAGAPSGKPEHLTFYAYGDGYGKGHNTDALCNPLSSCD